MSAWGCSFLFFNARTRAFTQPVFNNSPAKRYLLFVFGNSGKTAVHAYLKAL